MARWRVDIIRKRAEHLGTVEAPDQSEAILEAIKRFEIPPDRQNRITVEKMTKNKDHRPCLGPVLSELPCGFFGAIEKKWRLRQRRCLEVASRPAILGLVDETRRTYRHHGRQRGAPRRIATFHHATLRVAPHRYATRGPLGTSRRLSRV